MKKLKKWLATGLIGLFLMLGCGHFAGKRGYDYNFNSIHKSIHVLKDIQDSIIIYHCKVTFKEDLPPSEFQGVGFTLDGKYIITPTHVVGIPESAAIRTPIGIWAVPATAEKMEIWIEKEGLQNFLEMPCRIPLQCKRGPGDVSILWAENETFDVLPTEVGDSDKIEVGQVVLTTTYPHWAGRGFDRATIMNLSAWKIPKETDLKNENLFMIDEAGIRGDSGSPVFALQNGKLKLIGTIDATWYPSIPVGGILKINHILKHAEKLVSEVETQ